MPEEAADADVLQRESTIFVFEMTSVVSSPAREAQPFGAPGIPEFCGRRGRQAQCPGKCQDPSSRCHFDLEILYVMPCKGEKWVGERDLALLRDNCRGPQVRVRSPAGPAPFPSLRTHLFPRLLVPKSSLQM